jgi:hypothetical protein
MSVFDFDTEGQAVVAEQAAANPITPDQMHPGFWDNTGESIGKGIMRGGAKVGQFIGMGVIAAPLVMTEKLLGKNPGEYTDSVFRALDDYINSAVDYWTPGPAEVGTAGKVLGGFSEIVLPLMAGGGNPSLMIGTQGLSGATELSRKGATPGAAVSFGILQGFANAVGFRIPFLGKTLLSKMASGAVGNLAVNEGSSELSKQILARTGNEELAKEFAPNAESGAVDVLSGLIFGAITHAQMPSIRDAAATVGNAKHFQEDTAPGTPADINSSVAHQNAMEAAIRDTLSGEPVDVSKTNVMEGQFIPRPREPFVGELPADFRDLNKADELPALKESAIPRDESLPPADRATESRFAQQLESDVSKAMAEYAQLEGSDNGKILNTDLARELSSEYRADRTRSAAVHEPASWLVKEMYAKRLAEPLKPGEEPVVIMSAGGTGAGKTTGLQKLQEANPLLDRAQIIYDTNMNGLESSAKKIDQALSAGKSVAVVYTYRDPVKALVEGALTRAEGSGKGRTVPLDKHAETHVGAASTVKALAERYKGDSRVTFSAVDNSGKKGEVKPMQLANVPHLEYNLVREDLSKALEGERKAGTISEAVYRGFAGQGASDRPGSRPGDHQSLAGKSGLAQDPVVAAAHQAVAQTDFQVPTGEVNPDGSVKTVSARDLLAQARQGVIQAEHDAKAFEAIAGCILTRGAS